MNEAEQIALNAMTKGEGKLFWVKIEGRGLWLYVNTFNGKVFEYTPPQDNVFGTDLMTEVRFKGASE